MADPIVVQHVQEATRNAIQNYAAGLNSRLMDMGSRLSTLEAQVKELIRKVDGLSMREKQREKEEGR